jgi:hypothetical protein
MPPAGDDRAAEEQRRRRQKEQRDPVDADQVADLDARDPVRRFEQLKVGVGAIKGSNDQQRAEDSEHGAGQGDPLCPWRAP